MGEDVNQVIGEVGAIYLEGKKIADVTEIPEFKIESVTYNPETGDASIEGIRPFMEGDTYTMTFAFDRPFFNKRLHNRLMGWKKNCDKPRKRMRSKAAKLQYAHRFFITAKRLERLMRRHKEQARRRWLKTGYDPVWHYVEETEAMLL